MNRSWLAIVLCLALLGCEDPPAQQQTTKTPDEDPVPTKACEDCATLRKDLERAHPRVDILVETTLSHRHRVVFAPKQKTGSKRLVYRLEAAKGGPGPKALDAVLERYRDRLKEDGIQSRVLSRQRLLIWASSKAQLPRVKQKVTELHGFSIRGITDSRDEDPGKPGWFGVPQDTRLAGHPLAGKWVQLSSPGVTQEHLLGVPPGPSRLSDPDRPQSVFGVPLTSEGEDAFAQFTTTFQGKNVAILFGGRIHPECILYVQEGGLRRPVISVSSAEEAVTLWSHLAVSASPMRLVATEQDPLEVALVRPDGGGIEIRLEDTVVSRASRDSNLRDPKRVTLHEVIVTWGVSGQSMALVADKQITAQQVRLAAETIRSVYGPP